MTVSDAINLMKVIKKRIDDLSNIRSKVSVSEIFYSSTEKEVKPEYDIKDVDLKIIKLEKIRFDLDNAIKKSNASTVLYVGFDDDEIFKPLQ